MVGVVDAENSILDDMKKASDFRRASLDKENEALEAKIATITKETEALSSRLTKIKNLDLSPADIAALEHELVALIADSTASRMQVENIRIMLDNYKEEYFSAMKREQEWRKSVAAIPSDALLASARFGKIGFWIGIFAMFLGFSLWFFRSQIHQDEILEFNKEKAEVELKRSKFELNQLMQNNHSTPSK